MRSGLPPDATDEKMLVWELGKDVLIQKWLEWKWWRSWWFRDFTDFMLNVSPLTAIGRLHLSSDWLGSSISILIPPKSFPKKLRSSKKGSSDFCVIIYFPMYQCIVYFWKIRSCFCGWCFPEEIDMIMISWSDVCWGETIQAVSIGYDVTSCWNEAQFESFCFDWSQQRCRGRFFPKFDMM